MNRHTILPFELETTRDMITPYAGVSVFGISPIDMDYLDIVGKATEKPLHQILAQLRQLRGYFCVNPLKLHNPSKKVGTTNYVLNISEEDSI